MKLMELMIISNQVEEYNYIFLEFDRKGLFLLPSLITKIIKTTRYIINITENTIDRILQ